MELRQYARLVLSYWPLLAACTIGGALAGVGLTVTQPNTYESTAILSATGGGSSGTSPDRAYQKQLLSQARVQTYAVLAGQPVVLEAAASELGDVSADELASSLTVDVPEDTTLIRIQAKADAADSARLRADTVASALANKVQSTGTDAGPGLVVVQAATLPRSPAPAGLILNTLLGGFMGLLLGIAIASMHQYLRGRVRDGTELATVLSIPVIGPVASAADNGSNGQMGLRDLATLVLLRHGDRCGPIVLIGVDRKVDTGGLAMQLARMLAGPALRVIVISDEADLPPDAPTFVDIVTRGTTPELYPTGGVPRGHVAALRSGLAADDAPPVQIPRAQRALAALGHQADVVLVDSPPLADGIDGAILAGATGSTFLVVRARKTRRDAVSAAVRRLQAVSAELEAIIVTTRGR